MRENGYIVDTFTVSRRYSLQHDQIWVTIALLKAGMPGPWVSESRQPHRVLHAVGLLMHHAPGGQLKRTVMATGDMQRVSHHVQCAESAYPHSVPY